MIRKGKSRGARSHSNRRREAKNIVMDHTPSVEQEMQPRKEINQSKERIKKEV